MNYPGYQNVSIYVLRSGVKKLIVDFFWFWVARKSDTEIKTSTILDINHYI